MVYKREFNFLLLANNPYIKSAFHDQHPFHYLQSGYQSAPSFRMMAHNSRKIGPGTNSSVSPTLTQKRLGSGKLTPLS